MEERLPSAEAARGNAFAAYVLPEVEVLLRVAMTLTARPADAEDLVQATLLRAYRAIDRFDGKHPRAWLLTIARHPRTVAVALGWPARTVRRVGVGRLLWHGFRIRPVTFVMHLFMDAEDVAPAWELMQQGETSDDPGLRETQERLVACRYSMAHPENGTLVPACVQHSVLAPVENAELRRLLRIVEVRTSARK